MDDTEDSRKRKAGGGNGGDDANKRSKTRKQWGNDPRKSYVLAKNRVIQPGDSGIWATCDKGREGKCIGELKDLFNSYAEELYSEQLSAEKGDDDDDEDMDVEAAIKAEVEGIKRPVQEPLFIPIKLDVQCVLFFKTRAPIEPVSFVQHICRDALNNPNRKRTRFAKRLSPMTLMGRASEEGLESVATEVLAPHFRKTPVESRKFAIRPSLRNHSVLKRDMIIQKVASLVGPGHKVDLKNYDDLILVEFYTNVCGMAVVPSDFEELKRYNLAEIFDPSPKEQPKSKKETFTANDEPVGQRRQQLETSQAVEGAEGAVSAVGEPVAESIVAEHVAVEPVTETAVAEQVAVATEPLTETAITDADVVAIEQ